MLLVQSGTVGVTVLYVPLNDNVHGCMSRVLRSAKLAVDNIFHMQTS